MRLGNLTPAWTTSVSPPVAMTGVATIILAPLFGWALAHERWLAVVALMMLIAVPVFIRWPLVSAFGLYAFVVPFDAAASLFQAGGTTMTAAAGLMAGAVLAIAGLMERRLVRPPAASLWFGLLVVWAALTAAWAIDPDNTLTAVRRLTTFFVLYLVAVCVRPSRKELHGVCLLLAAGGAIVAFLCYMSLGDPAAADADGRGRLVIGDQESNPNLVTGALLLPLALAISAVLGARGAMQKAVTVGVVGVLGAGMYSSMSRGGVLVILAMVAVFLYRLGPRRQLVLPVIVLFALLVAMPETFLDRIFAVVSGVDTTGTGRTEIWRVGISSLERFWLLGAGLNNFTQVHALYGFGLRAAAHNLFLGVWVDLGIPGLLLLLAAIGAHMLGLHRARRAGAGSLMLVALEAACFGTLALNMVGEELFRKHFWLLWVLLTWAINTESVEAKAPPGETTAV